MQIRLRPDLPYAECPLADSNLFHVNLSWRDKMNLLTKHHLISQPKVKKENERRWLKQQSRLFFDICFKQYGSVPLPFLTAFRAVSVLRDPDKVAMLFGREWTILPLTSEDSKRGGEIVKSLGENEVDDEYPLLVAMALRLKRSVVTAYPERYVSIKKHYEIQVINIRELKLYPF